MKVAFIASSLLLLSNHGLSAAASAFLPSDPRVVAFFSAVTAGDEKTLDSILQQYDPKFIDITDAQGNTALLKAVMSGNGQLVEYLLDKGATLQKNKALVFAIKANNLPIARTLYAHDTRLTDAQKKELASGPGAGVLIELDLIMPPLPSAEREDGVPSPPPAEGEGEEIPAAPTTFEQHLAQQVKPLTVPAITRTIEVPSAQEGEKATTKTEILAGHITAYTFNPNDPWLKNLWSQYDTVQVPGNVADASISSDGNWFMVAEQPEGENGHVRIYTKKNNQWSVVTPHNDRQFRVSHITMSATARRFVIRNPEAGVLETYTYNTKSNRWDKSKDLHIYSAADRIISGDGKRLAVLEKDFQLSVYDYKNNGWERIFSLDINKEKNLHSDHNNNPLRDYNNNPLKAISFDGTSIAYFVVTQDYRVRVLVLTLLNNGTLHTEGIEIGALVKSVSISDDNNYCIIQTVKKPSFSIYKRLPDKRWKLQQKRDVLGEGVNYNATVLFSAIRNSSDMQCVIYQRTNEDWLRSIIDIPHFFQQWFDDVQIKTAGNSALIFQQHSNNIYILALGKTTTQKELATLNANQLNFIRDIYEQDQVIKKSNNPNAWIILGADDVTLSFTLPKATQDALRSVYKLTTQKTIDVAKKKLADKKAQEDKKVAAAPVSVTKKPIPVKNPVSAAQPPVPTAAPASLPTAEPVAKRAIKKKIRKKNVNK